MPASVGDRERRGEEPVQKAYEAMRIVPHVLGEIGLRRRTEGGRRAQGQRRRSASLRIASWLIASAVFPGCSCSASPSGPVVASEDPRRNVMVIDEGFDVSVAALRDAVVAQYTMVCDDGADGGAGDDGGGGLDGRSDGGVESFDELEREFIAELMEVDRSCRLVEGIAPKADPLAAVSRYRKRWNAMIQRQAFGSEVFTKAEWEELQAAFEHEFETFAFHGTATASTIARDNPHVRLVLVERPLRGLDTAPKDFTCFEQEDVDTTVALLADPDVHEAYVHAPRSELLADFEQAIEEFRVGLMNESYGPLSREHMEALQIENGCPPVDLGAYLDVWGAAEADRREEQKAYFAVLDVQSAGNEGLAIEDRSDNMRCVPGDPRHVLVGSYGLSRTTSTFSNYGRCVEVYALGEHVIATYAGGWSIPVDGTSFAAPLVVRLVSMTAPTPFDPIEARSALLAQREPDGGLPMATWPRDAYYAPTRSLVGLSSEVGRPAPSPVEVGRALRPIRLFRALRAR